MTLARLSSRIRATRRIDVLTKVVSSVATAIVALAPNPAAAAPPEPLKLDWAELAPIWGIGAGLGGVALALGEPDTCRWCAPPAFDLALSDLARADDPATAALWSDILLVSMPVATLATGVVTAARHDPRTAGEDALVILAPTLLTIGVVAQTKSIVARRRPDAWRAVGSGDDPGVTEPDLSFFSGHASITAVLASSTATVAFLRGYEWAPYWAVGAGSAALSTGWLRVSAQRHWTSDVVVGTVVGTGVGVAIPLLLTPRAPRSEGRKGSRSQGLVLPVFWSVTW